MSRQFKTRDYEATLNSTIALREALPLNHLARCVVDVITRLDLSPLDARYALTGGIAIAPEILLGLLFYGYSTGVFGARKIERACVGYCHHPQRLSQESAGRIHWLRAFDRISADAPHLTYPVHSLFNPSPSPTRPLA